jgi:hypothetical protein
MEYEVNHLFQKRCPKKEKILLLEVLSYGVRTPFLEALSQDGITAMF